ncbi:MAG: DUF882 domain-containing protein [Gemmatimonadaceae bacterium]|nr:DUF882 domain-containing protein [Gemmatimonadaceae bacterium]
MTEIDLASTGRRDIRFVPHLSRAIRASLTSFAVAALAPASAAASYPAVGALNASAPVVGAVTASAPVPLPDSMAGRSGKLRARLVSPRRDSGIRILRELFGDSAIQRPGIYHAADSASGRRFSLINLLPFQARERGKLGGYRVGFWPGEKRGLWASTKSPEGFIEVTPSNQDTQLSDNFRLRDFLTHDQQDVWPKYLVLREALVDKLELLMTDLRTRGYAVARLSVMSGFRTPQYNAQGVGKRGGRATDSRHQYGDAADVFVDNNGDGRMDDLNRDGRVDTRDAKVVLESVERIEANYPELVGGAGLYRATSAHGPFVHVDVRGSRARWGRS